MLHLLFWIFGSISTSSALALRPTDLSGPKLSDAPAVAWGAKRLQNYTGFTAEEFKGLDAFSSQPALLERSNATAIWDYFPDVDESRYPLIEGAFMQNPLAQDPSALVATACDACFSSTEQQLVDLNLNSSDWTQIWDQASSAYSQLLNDDGGSKNGSMTNFKFAMRWFTSVGQITGIPSNRTAAAFGNPSPTRPTSVCSSVYLEGFTAMNSASGNEIEAILPRHFQDLSVHCGCDFFNSGSGSTGSPFRGGWKVVMRGKREAWRFRIEQGGAGCFAQLDKSVTT